MVKRNTVAIGIRLPVEEIEAVRTKAGRRGESFNKVIGWMVKQGLRSHKSKRKEENNG